MAKWYHEFTAGRRDVHDDKRSGRPSVVTDCFIQKIEEKIHADRRITMDELHEQCSEVSRTVRYETSQLNSHANWAYDGKTWRKS
ncbi:hypothetical protein Cfor_08341 [Coptotermes formosanus]|uniref:Mos1 transposase HTH domain-containing protein n=1 Tax=Coptotermes formosanus TaxID=36987 RepID=A0A6L2Q7A1_COPFO|nr:hypothetical protein Cfor_08341 [Coptotermes formosanus]